MHRLFIASAVALALSATAPFAEEEQDVDARIEAVLGDVAAFHEAFDAIKQAVAAGDGPVLAGYVPYGVPINIHGEQRVFESEHDFYSAYDEIMLPEIVATVAAQKWEDLFVNADGVMFGSGELWLNGICADDACTSFDVKIVAIQAMPD